MSERTVDWTSFGVRSAETAGTTKADAADGLRERKKRVMRQQLSDTATEMFLAKGFDAVRVSEIAAACGVSEKTVFNYFPTKEALILDRLETAPGQLAEALADAGTAPLEAVLNVLSAELAAMTGWMAAQPDFRHAVAQVARFGVLLGSTPSLRAHQREATERLSAEVARILAERVGTQAGDVEPLVAANALLGLWAAQYAALRRHLGDARSADQLYDAVTADVRRAAAIVQDGLRSWPGESRPI